MLSQDIDWVNNLSHQHSNAQKVNTNQLKRIFKKAIRDKISGISLVPNCISCNKKSYLLYDCLSQEEFISFTKEMYNWSRSLNKNSTTDIVPFWINSDILNKSYGMGELVFSKLYDFIPEQVKFFWSGSSEYSLYTDNADMYRIIKLLGSKPLWWDNSLLSYDQSIRERIYPEKLNLYNLFQPYSNTDLMLIFQMIDTNQIFFNFSVENEIDLIRMISAVSFAWNMNSYDPDITLWHILQSRYGFESARELILLNDDYANFLRITAELENPSHYQRLIRQGETVQSNLKQHIDSISNSMLGENKNILIDLEYEINELNKKFSEKQIHIQEYN